jgi:hypothetical protein
MTKVAIRENLTIKIVRILQGQPYWATLKDRPGDKLVEVIGTKEFGVAKQLALSLSMGFLETSQDHGYIVVSHYSPKDWEVK